MTGIEKPSSLTKISSLFRKNVIKKTVESMHLEKLLFVAQKRSPISLCHGLVGCVL